MHMSLDGYVAAANDSPGLSDAGEDLWDVVAALTRDADTLLLGRAVAGELLGYWLTAERDDPNLSNGARQYAPWASGAPKVVLSNRDEQWPWNNVLMLVRDDQEMERAVSTVKQQPGKNIVVHGGVRTARKLARLNLIDEYQLVVHPVALGDGRALFKDLTSRLQLNLTEAANLQAGSVVLWYRPVTTETGRATG